MPVKTFALKCCLGQDRFHSQGSGAQRVAVGEKGSVNEQAALATEIRTLSSWRSLAAWAAPLVPSKCPHPWSLVSGLQRLGPTFALLSNLPPPSTGGYTCDLSLSTASQCNVSLKKQRSRSILSSFFCCFRDYHVEAPASSNPSVLPPLVEENGGLQKVSAGGEPCTQHIVRAPLSHP